MIPTKRVARVLGCMLVMGFGAELQAAGLRANLSNRLSFPSRARFANAMPTEESFRNWFYDFKNWFYDFRNWFYDNVRTPKDEFYAVRSFQRRYLKLKTKLDGLKGSASYVASVASLRAKAIQLSKQVHEFHGYPMQIEVSILWSSGPEVKAISYESICDVYGNVIQADQFKRFLAENKVYYKFFDEKGRRKFVSIQPTDNTVTQVEKARKYEPFVTYYDKLSKHASLIYGEANMEWNDGKITRFLPATYEQRYGALSGTLATAMLMRWISKGEHPGQQVKKLAKVPGRLLSRARGMITRNPSE